MPLTDAAPGGASPRPLDGVGGWLVVYLVGSLPLLLVYAVGLSGWFFEYPIALMIAIFVALAIPLALILVRSPRAPRWNVVMLWGVVVLMALRSVSVFLLPMAPEGTPPISREELPAIVATLAGIIAVSLAWAVVWTRYFTTSVRVRQTLGEG